MQNDQRENEMEVDLPQNFIGTERMMIHIQLFLLYHYSIWEWYP